ncbi:hypothetical protein GCM10027053_26170 [Intrasporangium mesophilum]
MTSTAESRIRSNTQPFCAEGEPVWRGDSTEPKGPGAEYSAFLKDLVDAEEKRSTGMETRGIAVITTSGALVTLLLGLSTLVTRVQSAVLPTFSLWAAALAGVGFVASAICAALANSPWKEWGLNPSCLRAELWERFGDPGDDPTVKVMSTRLRLWESAHQATQRKAKLVFSAVVLQGFAVLTLASAAIAILVTR